jgi:hypothetical protein
MQKAVIPIGPHSWKMLQKKNLLVGAEGFEPPTLWSQTRCATRLRYAPTWLVYRITPATPLQKPQK